MTIEPYWGEFYDKQRRAVYRFIAHDVRDGYYYFRDIKSGRLISKKQTELYIPEFKPIMIYGEKQFFSGPV